MENILSKSRTRFLLISSIILLAAFLRLYHLTNDPPGLYIDEISIASNAHSIVASGVDEHGKKYPVFFKAYGEYKYPVYVYLTALSENLFGKGEFAVRLPSAFLGTLTILIVYLLLRNMISIAKKEQDLTLLPLVASFLLAVSPWSIQFSRAGFEATVAIFLYLLGVLLILKYLKRDNILYLFVSTFSLVASMYTYQVFVILTPLSLFCIYLYIYFRKKDTRTNLIKSIILLAFLLIPLALFSLSPEGGARFAQTSAFSKYTDLTILQKVFKYPMIYLKNYISYFSFEFLFNTGDKIGRHQMPGFGLFYKWQFPFLLLGFASLLKVKNSIFKYFVLFLLFISPLAAATTLHSPHSLRSLLLSVPLSVVIALGLIQVKKIKNKKIFLTTLFTILMVFSVEFVYYLHFYYSHYPKTNIPDWGGGYKEVVKEVSKVNNKYDKILLDSRLPFMSEYFSYYNDSIQVTPVDKDWSKPEDWKGIRVLVVRANLDTKKDDRLIEKVRVDNLNRDVVAELWEY